tara:strand:+ start:83 stop:412 length:330 start_codon:yes stop_codon:yes gene_type:complete
MKKYKFCIIFLSFAITLQSCGTVSEGFGGSKRSKTGDEFLVHKKRPLVLPPDFKKMPSPKPMDETGKKLSKSETNIEDLLNIKNQGDDKTFNNPNNGSLERSILKKIKQ